MRRLLLPALLLALGAVLASWLLLDAGLDGVPRAGGAAEDDDRAAREAYGLDRGSPEGALPRAAGALRGSAPSRLAVRVRDARTGAPLAEAAVRLVADAPVGRDLGVVRERDVVASAVTDEDGLAEVDVPGGVSADLTRVLASHGEHVPGEVPWRTGMAQAEIALEPGHVIEGRVEDLAGEPLADLVVRAREDAVPRVDGPPLTALDHAAWRAARTAEDGSFRLAGLRADEEWHLQVEAAGLLLASAYQGLIRWDPDPFPVPAERVRLVMAPARFAHVRFVDPEGRPVGVLPDRVVLSAPEELDDRTFSGWPGVHEGIPAGPRRRVREGMQVQDPSRFLARIAVTLDTPPSARTTLRARFPWHEPVEEAVRLRRADELGEPDVVVVRPVPLPADEGRGDEASVLVREQGPCFPIPSDHRVFEAEVLRTEQHQGYRWVESERVRLLARAAGPGSWRLDRLPASPVHGLWHLGTAGAVPLSVEPEAGKETTVALELGTLGRVLLDARDDAGRRRFGFGVQLYGETTGCFVLLPDGRHVPRLAPGGDALEEFAFLLPAGDRYTWEHPGLEYAVRAGETALPTPRRTPRR